MNLNRKKEIQDILISNIKDLEKQVLEAHTFFTETPGYEFLTDRLDGLLDSINTIKSYVPELNMNLEINNIDEIIRVTNVINELSYMIREECENMIYELSGEKILLDKSLFH